ncbi:MAG: LAGLIDADG family homing endonuclease [Thaumarchaeota archaeon]|nr:LAGLIDADG family homing endonuclease [Nitrososphaerota archaeon]
MDNPQATPYEIGYLAGLIDGEGCIAIQKTSGNSFGINLKITNTDEHIIEKAQSIMLKIGVNPLIRDRVNTNNPQWRGWMEVYLTKKDNIKKVLEIVLPYLVGKYPRAIMMLRFIDKSIDREDAYWQMKAMNKKGESPETTREAPKGTSYDDCSGNWNGIINNVAVG